MINKESGEYKFICDICGDESEETFETFDDAVDNKKSIGWTSKKIEGQWADLCPGCQN